KWPLYETATKTPRLDNDLKDDFPSYFAKCTVRAMELKMKKISPNEQKTTLERNNKNGYVLMRPLITTLKSFEKSEPSIKQYFPDLMRGIDEKAETKHLATIQFAPIDTANTDETATEA